MNGNISRARFTNHWMPVTVLVALCLPVWSKPVFQLTPDDEGVLENAEEKTVTWEPGIGRFGGTGLQVSGGPSAERRQIMVFSEPRQLLGPERYRVECWIRAAEGTGRVDVYFYEASTGKEINHKTILNVKNSQEWCYGACDISIQAEENLAYNIALSVSGEKTAFDGIAVHASNSILPNGDFKKLETYNAGRGEKQPNIPWGWRRLIFNQTEHDEAEVTYFVQEDSDGNRLHLEKGKGFCVLSAEPVHRFESKADLVARVYTDAASTLMPVLAIQQYGPHGLLIEHQSSPTAKVIEDRNQICISTDPIPQHPDMQRVVLLLHYPMQSGSSDIGLAELVLLEKEKPDIQIFANQAGYEAGTPMRFVVASDIFPTGGRGRFVLRSNNGKHYDGRLLALGRSTGANQSDWGSYYFEAVLSNPEAGDYILEAFLGDGTASLANVKIHKNLLLEETGELGYRFYSIQRCGCEVPGWHGLCHMDDGRLPDGTRVDVTGGYHNAGDFHKHMMDNTPVSVYGMISAYERYKDYYDAIDRDGSGHSDLLEEVLWGSDWLKKMVDPKTGHIWMNVTNDIDYYGIPENDTDGISGTDDDRLIGTNDPYDLGAFTMAAWAALSRHVEDPSYLKYAKNLWAVYEKDILAGYNPRHIFSALELYQCAQNEAYRQAAEVLAERLLSLQNQEGWYARTPGGNPEFRILDEGTTPAALATFALAFPDSPLQGKIRSSLRDYFIWCFRITDNPFGLLRNYDGGEWFYFKSRGDWFGGNNSEYCSVAWAAFLTAHLFVDEPDYAESLYVLASNQIHWLLGMNPLDLCMFEGVGNSHRIYFHHLYAEIPGHPRGAVPGAIPNGIIREPGNADRPWFDLRDAPGSLAGAESAEPWLPHNGYYLLMLSSTANFVVED